MKYSLVKACMITLNKKAALVTVNIVAIIAIAGGVALSRDTAQTAKVKGVSTAAAQNEQTPVPTFPKATDETSSTTAPNGQPAARQTVAVSSKPQSPAQQQNTSTSTTPSNPSPAPAGQNPQPAPVEKNLPMKTMPQPSFHITLRSDDAYIQDISHSGVDAMQLIVPFDIVKDAGFTGSKYAMPYCTFTAVPSITHGVVCNVSQKYADSGTLILQYNDSSSHGQYAVKVTYTIGEIISTDTVEFQLTTGNPSVE